MPHENYKKNENHGFSLDNHENHETIEILYENQ